MPMSPGQFESVGVPNEQNQAHPVSDEASTLKIRRTCSCVSGFRRSDLRSLDLFVLGACAIDAERGIGAFDFDDAQMKASLIESAGSTVLAVQNKKLGTVATHRIAAIGAIADVVVEADASRSLTKRLLSKGIRVHFAKPAQSKMADSA